ncbi:thiamine phosphate synthase [Hyphomonas adhaerens]|uniref:thiamine phosphate synthase n=1 Tax=Hyphomonas adhaerens TaxID=81029 RepID=UPI0023526026|nr:thiamine phosphate synthase [Hyphomonas adhaerens]|tara:strand:- start:510 stop:1163 length:654 start_codon:yes stop_codon:yes gene_type:complete
MTQEDRNRAERKLCTAARVAGRHLPPGLPPVLYLTDPARTPDPVVTAGRLSSWHGLVYRHYGQPGHALVAADLAKVCRDRHVRLLIANDPRLAMQVGADGVHWPFAARGEVRKWRTRFSLMTASAHTPEQLRLLQDAGVDAALLSTAFPSASPSARTPLGPLKVRKLARASALPVYALGGINADTSGQVAPVAGIAAIEGIEAVFGPQARTWNSLRT